VKSYRGKINFPGGFIRWREHPVQAARRECREETGLNIEGLEMIGAYTHVSSNARQVSTIHIVFAGKLAQGGELRGSVEGQPIWVTEAEMRRVMGVRSAKMLEDYFAHRKGAGAK
jgi:ADP-ribose pyrophosphatase YjhB (NUDIX family)